ncbi:MULTISPECIES: DUF58 domain-containing protein [Halopenitus]|uniref:Uncharacterized conserved protein, DUF58 family, contains vWF domain n=2 Tax=Halopenitus TaxID=1209988 RepID=A0A1H6IHG5_9EURY|nr:MULTISPECIES: DUF58 domain-containing protein [Halopenitus]SDY75287.1 Uncharacterized conserved protein, DUF58 family, contains vWF domain [Halopenitus persicus]SEH45712.1 Uncharacterized conserved protein, DUF58 family, contains vWF domain [Halopenitus malekzadehii]
MASVRRTERYWWVLGLVVFFSLLTLVFTDVLFLVTTAGILGWLLVLEGSFRRHVQTVETAVSVSYQTPQTKIHPDEPLTVSVAAVTTQPLPITVAIDPNYPDVADGQPANEQLSLPPTVLNAATECQLRFPFAGNYDIGPATATVTSPYGFFEMTIPFQAGTTVTVTPRDTDSIHVGQAGEQFTVTYGEYGSGDTGSGIVPAGMRAYTPGDPVSRINWKVTARLAEVYVREFELETTRPLMIFFDGRVATSSAEGVESQLGYLRHVAALLVADAETHGDPVGLYHITADGVDASSRVSADPEQYLRIRDRLNRIESGMTSNGTTESTSYRSRSVATSTVSAERLQSDTSVFSKQLYPFITARSERFQRIEHDPLMQTVQTYLNQHSRDVRVAILTDDSRREELYDTIKFAGQQSPTVLSFLTPSVLFEPSDLTDIETIYSRYAEFERFRQQVEQIEHSTAFEIAPGEKLQAVLASERTQAE